MSGDPKLSVALTGPISDARARDQIDTAKLLEEAKLTEPARTGNPNRSKAFWGLHFVQKQGVFRAALCSICSI